MIRCSASGARARGAAGAVAVLAALLAVASPSGAVVGGAPADRSDFPFFATLGGNEPICGGSLVAPDRVLTAAHCGDGFGVGGRVRVGPDEVERRVSLVAKHPVAVREQARARSDAVAPADLMLLELSRPVTTIAPATVALPEEGLTAPGTLATTIGVGASRPSGGGGGTFRSGEVEIRNPERCGRELPNRLWRRWSLCTRDPRLPDPDADPPFVSACFGDSGGPLLADAGAGMRVVGVVSFGAFCGERRDPEVYANAVRARDFILAADPPWEPKADGRAQIAGAPRVGNRVRCEVDWIVEPTEPESYFWTAGHRALSEDGGTLRLRPSHEGRRLRCSVFARTEGGGTVVNSRPVRVRG